jgi:nucleotide-binding universal stress UspA family protein
MRKFLVVVDSSPECMNALRYAARRAGKTGGGVIMLYCTAPEDFQHWIGVADLMSRESRGEAEERLSALAEEVRGLAGVTPEFVIREGDAVDAVLAQIAEDPEIAVLALGADAAGEGPGPLVTALAGKRAGRMPVPVTVVPGWMTAEQIDRLA